MRRAEERFIPGVGVLQPAARPSGHARTAVHAPELGKTGSAAKVVKMMAPRRTDRTRRKAPNLLGRRALLGSGCALCGLPGSAHALAALQAPPAALSNAYDVPRDGLRDASFAASLSTGMGQYEAAVRATKTRLFSKLLDLLPATDALVVELGMGSFPNARFYAAPDPGEGPQKLDILGIDPNDAMATYAQRSADQVGLAARGHSVRLAHGVGEALPLADNVADAVVSTLTLCSVRDPARTLAEVVRVLKPGGRFLFLEHVLSETDPFLAKQQEFLTPLQTAVADGCHLNRRTLETIRTAPFATVDASYFDLEGFYYLNPTVAGIATKA